MPGKRFKVTTKTKLPILRESYDERSLYPWMNIRTEYIEGFENEEQQWIWPTTKELAERFNMPEKQLQNRIAKERWLEYKKAHQNQIAMERQREHAKKLAGRAIKFDEQSVEVAEFGITLLYERMLDLQKLKEPFEQNRAILLARVEDGEYVNPSQLKAGLVSGAELESWGKALALFAETGRKALGIKDGEPPVQQTNITVQQTSISEDFRRRDPDRIEAMVKILQNQNFSMPALTQKQDIEDADIVKEDEDDA